MTAKLQKLFEERRAELNVTPAPRTATIKDFYALQSVEQTCEIHGDKMFILRGHVSCAKCGLEQIERERKQEYAEREQKRLEILLNTAQLPKRHQRCDFSNFTVNNAHQQLVKAQAYNYVAQHQESNAVLLGNTGTGKTHLACAMAAMWLKHGKSVRYIRSADFADYIMQTWSENDKTQKSEIDKFASYDILILDEYGLHDQHEKRLEIVHQLLYARYDEMKPTVLISNFTAEQLKDNLGDRLWSRFQHDGVLMLECNWSDNRLAEENHGK